MSRLSKNIVYNLVGQGLLLILGFVAVRYVFKRLGEDALGIVYFALTMNSVLCAVLEMGICSTTTREVASRFQDEPGYVHALLRTASLFYWATYVLLAGAVYLGAPFLMQKWVTLATMDASAATHVLRILGISGLLGLPRSLYASVFRGLERMEFNNIIDVSTTALQQAGVIVVLVSGGTLLHVAYWLAVCFGVGVVCYILATRLFFPWWALAPGYSVEVVRKNYGYSWNTMLISVLATVQTQADKVLVSRLLPLASLGYYGFAYGTVYRGTLLTNAIATAAFPSLSSLFGMGRREGMMSQYRKLQDLLCFGTAPLFAAIPFAALPVFGYVFNPEIARMLLIPATFVALGFYMHGTVNVPYVFSLAVGKPNISARSNFYALFIVLPVTAVSIYYFGLAGAGFSWVFYNLFVYGYAVPRICSECLAMPVRSWYAHVLKILGAIGLTYGIAWLVLRSAEAYTLWALAGAYLAASFGFLIVAYRMLGRELRESVGRLLRFATGMGERAVG